MKVLEQANYIFYSIGNYHEGYEIVYLEKREKSWITRKELPQNVDKTSYKPVYFFEQVFLDIKKMIEGWEPEYTNPDVLDGTQWELLISVYSKDETDRLTRDVDDPNEIPGILFFYGSNEYPDNFELLERYMEEI